MEGFSGKYLALTSFRRDGTGVLTPVWFVGDDGHLLVETDADSYKVKRIRRDAHVRIAPCDARGRVHGEAVEADARILPGDERERAERLLAEKYRIERYTVLPIYRLALRLRERRSRSHEPPVVLELTPREDVRIAAGRARLPPRWFVETFWRLHRRVVAATRGRRGLWPPRPERWGALRLTTTGRRSGRPRSVIVGYYEDGPNLVTMAMNGWGAAEPAWWLNLQADPRAVVELAGRARRDVVGRSAVGAERERLWQRWRELDESLDAYAARRPRETAVVVLEPRTAGK